MKDPVEILEGVVDSLREVNPIVGALEGKLEGAEETPSTREGNGHAAEFTKQFVPFFTRSPFLGPRNGSENLGESVDAVLGELDSHGDCINQPAQDNFDGGPGDVALAELFETDGFAAGPVVVVVIGSEDVVDGVEQGSADGGGRARLAKAEEVVNKDIDIMKRC